MKCPGCNFVCSELRDICPKCLIDLRPFKKGLGLTIVNSALSYEELVAKVKPQKSAPATSSPERSGTGLTERILSSVGSFWGRSNSHSAQPPPHPANIPSALATPPSPTRADSAPTTVLEATSIAPTEEPEAPHKLEGGAVATTIAPFETLQASDTGTYETFESIDRISHWIGPANAQVEENLEEDPTPADEAIEIDSDALAEHTGQATSPPASSNELARGVEPEPRETFLIVTSDDFPSLVHATGPAFRWISPVEAQSANESDDELAETGIETEECANLDLVQTEVPLASEPDALETVSPQADLEPQPMDEEVEIDALIDALAETPAGSVSTTAIPPSSNVESDSQPSRLIEQSLTVSPVIASTIDTRSVEQAFGSVYCTMNGWAASGDIDLSATATFTELQREGITLLFSQCLDLLEGKVLEEPIADIALSENRDVISETLDQQLEQFEKTVATANAPRKLREVAALRTSARVSRPASEELASPSAVRRMIVGLLDLIAVAIASAIIACIFERGGLPAVVAEISIDGLTTRHFPIISSALALAPLVGIAYLFTSYVVLGNTLPARIFTLALRTENGRKLKFQHMVVRSASVPLALCLGGYIPVLFGRASLTDRLARTKVLLDD